MLINVVSIRFSLRLSDEWCARAYGAEENRERWFAYRSDIFAKTLLKSILSQKKTPEYIFILMHVDDKIFYEKYFPKSENLIFPVFVNIGFGEFEIPELLPELPCLAVSRLDSDDVISIDYFEKINKSIVKAVDKGEPFRYVVSCCGYRSDGREFQNIYYNCSPFITLYTSNKRDINVYGIAHEDVLSSPHIQNYDAEWLQFLHSSNVSNAFVYSENDIETFMQLRCDNPKLIFSKRIPLEIGLLNRFGLEELPKA